MALGILGSLYWKSLKIPLVILEAPVLLFQDRTLMSQESGGSTPSKAKGKKTSDSKS